MMRIPGYRYFVDKDGNHPPPLTVITVEDIAEGKWRAAPGFEEEAWAFMLRASRPLAEIWPLDTGTVQLNEDEESHVRYTISQHGVEEAIRFLRYTHPTWNSRLIANVVHFYVDFTHQVESVRQHREIEQFLAKTK